jgi:hypothetical protein
VIETHQACLLNLPDLIPDEPSALHVATQLSQRVRRYWFVLRRAQIFKAPGGTLGLNYIGLVAPAISAIQALSSEVQNLIAEVQGFAQSFTSAVGNFGKVNTQQLCITDSAGTPICVTGDQLAALLAGQAPTSGGTISMNNNWPMAGSHC